MKKLLSIFILTGFIFSPWVMADKIYSWVDDKGVTHYGEQPPKNTPARLLNARTGHSDPVEYASNDEKKAAPAEKAKAAEPSAERCDLVRKNLQTLMTNPRVKTTDENGEVRVMTPEERQSQVDNMEAIIADECGDL